MQLTERAALVGELQAQLAARPGQEALTRLCKAQVMWFVLTHPAACHVLRVICVHVTYRYKYKYMLLGEGSSQPATGFPDKPTT